MSLSNLTTMNDKNSYAEIAKEIAKTTVVVHCANGVVNGSAEMLIAKNLSGIQYVLDASANDLYKKDSLVISAVENEVAEAIALQHPDRHIFVVANMSLALCEALRNEGIETVTLSQFEGGLNLETAREFHAVYDFSNDRSLRAPLSPVIPVDLYTEGGVHGPAGYLSNKSEAQFLTPVTLSL